MRDGELRELRSVIEDAKKDAADSHRRLRQDFSDTKVDVELLKRAAKGG